MREDVRDEEGESKTGCLVHGNCSPIFTEALYKTHWEGRFTASWATVRVGSFALYPDWSRFDSGPGARNRIGRFLWSGSGRCEAIDHIARRCDYGPPERALSMGRHGQHAYRPRLRCAIGDHWGPSDSGAPSRRGTSPGQERVSNTLDHVLQLMIEHLLRIQPWRFWKLCVLRSPTIKPLFCGLEAPNPPYGQSQKACMALKEADFKVSK